MRLRLHIFFRILKCSPGREAAAEAPSFTGATPANCRIQRPEVPPSKRSWSPLEVPFPNPHCPCIPHPQILSPRQVLSLSSGESVLESFNRLSHHWGNFCEKRNRAVVSDLWQFRNTPLVVYSKPRSCHTLGSAPPDKWIEAAVVC